MESKDRINQTQYYNNMNSNPQNSDNNMSSNDPRKFNSEIDLLNEINLNLIRLRVKKEETLKDIIKINTQVDFLLWIVPLPAIILIGLVIILSLFFYLYSTFL